MDEIPQLEGYEIALALQQMERLDHPRHAIYGLDLRDSEELYNFLV